MRIMELFNIITLLLTFGLTPAVKFFLLCKEALRGLDLGYDVGMCLISAPFNADDVPAIISVC